MPKQIAKAIAIFPYVPDNQGKVNRFVLLSLFVNRIGVIKEGHRVNTKQCKYEAGKDRGGGVSS